MSELINLLDRISEDDLAHVSPVKRELILTLKEAIEEAKVGK